MSRKFCIIAFVISAMLLSGGCSIIDKMFARSVPGDRGTVTVKGITGTVTISRDILGVPCVEADNENDLFFGAGYASAADRLWQMYAMSMIVQGRLAEIAGAEMLNIDLFMRTINAKKRVDEEMANMGPKFRSILESYAKGVNAYMEQNPKLPAEFVLARYRPEPWKPEDCLYVFGMLAINVSFNFIEELDFLIVANRLGYEKAAMLFPVYPDEDLPLEDALALSEIPAGDILKKSGLNAWKELREQIRGAVPLGIPASNNWALAGSRTRSGKSIVCNDTHLMLMIPNSWMHMHLKCPTYNAAGVLVPGVPVINLGFNGKLAWGATMVMADSQDIFIEKLRKTNGKTEYLFRGEWRPVTERKESFTIKGGETRNVTFEETHHGTLFNTALEKMPYPPELPIQPLPVQSDYGIAMCFAMEGGTKTLEGFYRMGSASTMAEARRALRLVESIYLNIVYGDRDNIGWQVTGVIPMRKKGRGMLPVPGWTGEYDWTGFAKTDQNPHSTNPPSGFIGTANNRIVPKDHPLKISACWYNPDRAERITELLTPMKNADMDIMIKMQHEHFSPMARKTQKLLADETVRGGIRAASAALCDAKRKLIDEALDMLAGFDCVMDRDSASAAVMGAFWHSFTRETFLDELGPENGTAWDAFLDANSSSYGAPEDHLLVRHDSPFFDNINTPGRETFTHVLASSLAGAMELCSKKMGSDRKSWKWGTIHTYHWKHDFTKQTRFFHGFLNRGPYPASGDVHSLDVTSFSWGENFDTWLIPAMRLVVDFGREEPAALISVPGQSGNPSSPHYADMIPYFLEGRNHPLPFRDENIKKQYMNVLTLNPEK